MNETNSRGGIGRTIIAVLAGFLVTAILSIATDVLMHAFRIFPPMGQTMSNALFIFATVYRSIYTVLGGYITARLALNNPMGHVWALGILGVLAAIAGTVATWNKGPEFGPKWYPLALIVLAIPCVWLGGKLQRRNQNPA